MNRGKGLFILISLGAVLLMVSPLVAQQNGGYLKAKVNTGRARESLLIKSTWGRRQTSVSQGSMLFLRESTR